MTLCPAACLFAEEKPVDFTIHPEKILAEEFVGFGAHVNGWIYAPPNWGEGGFNDKNIKDLEQKWIDLAPQHVRIFVEIPSVQKYPENPQLQESVARTIALMQRAGATVNCTLWHGPYPDLNEAAQEMADLMADYIRNRKLTAVKYVTLQNEPNSTKLTLERYDTLYQAFDAAMRKNGLRDQIKIIGGDLLIMQQKEWLENIATQLGDVCDGYSFHMYSDFWETDKLLHRVPAIAELAASLPKDRQRPLYITEFGFRGHRTGIDEPGADDQGRPLADTMMYGSLVGWRIVDIVRNGFVAALFWDGFEARYDRIPMPSSLIAGPKENFRLRPHYHLMKMFTHTAKPGWKTVAVDGGDDEVIAAAMHSADGSAWTLYAANRSEKPRGVRLEHLPRDRAFHLVTWNATGDGKLIIGKTELHPDAGGRLDAQLPPQSVTAITSVTTSL